MLSPPLQAHTSPNRISADGLENANMTNLAIKGILGIASMAKISGALGEDTDAQVFGVRSLSLSCLSKC